MRTGNRILSDPHAGDLNRRVTFYRMNPEELDADGFPIETKTPVTTRWAAILDQSRSNRAVSADAEITDYDAVIIIRYTELVTGGMIAAHGGKQWTIQIEDLGSHDERYLKLLCKRIEGVRS